jgi:hypothetical protein
MYKVQMQNECACFKKSEYTNSNEFPTQQEAYKYANILAELMNEEFCSKHTFYAELSADNSFIIKAPLNLTFVSGCSTGVSCDTGCGSNDNWSLEETNNESCGSGCGCS